MANIDSPSVRSPANLGRDVSNLQFRVELFAEHHLPLVAAFSERYWSRPRTEEFYRWRYLESLPFSKLYLALTSDECLGMVSALRKPYLLAGQRVTCLEIFDWHSLPGLRGSGVGIRVMRAMMREGERLIGLGGTADVLKALPAMGWQTIDSAVPFELPMSGGYLDDAQRQRVRFRIPGQQLALNAAVATWFHPRRRDVQGDAILTGTLGNEVQQLYSGDTGYDFVQVPDRGVLHWVTSSYPGTGGFAFWYFTVGNSVRGWVVTRVYEAEGGTEAAIVDVFAPVPDLRLYTWMVSEATTSLVSARPRVIRARATCPILKAALRRNRFRPGTPVPVFTWPKMPSPAVRAHMTLNHCDACLRPYPTPELPTRFLIG
jgi:hypothetical protein